MASLDMDVWFPGKLLVDASYKGYTVRTDQPLSDGGDGSAPSPTDLFFLSIGTCAGYYMLRFLQERGLPTEGAGIHLSGQRDPETHLVSSITLDLHTPAGFPEKYHDAIIRSVDLCTVKRHLKSPPSFQILVSSG